MKTLQRFCKPVAAVLLALAPDADGRRWGIASDFSSVDRLYRTLRRRHPCTVGT